MASRSVLERSDAPTSGIRRAVFLLRVASDGPYSIEDVPWIMYFNGSIALHGAFWHSNFGHVQSHGCVNLAPTDARVLFGWTEPQLPTGWHGVEATADKPGTRVVVHDPPESHPKWAE